MTRCLNIRSPPAVASSRARYSDNSPTTQSTMTTNRHDVAASNRPTRASVPMTPPGERSCGSTLLRTPQRYPDSHRLNTNALPASSSPAAGPVRALVHSNPNPTPTLLPGRSSCVNLLPRESAPKRLPAAHLGRASATCPAKSAHGHQRSFTSRAHAVETTVSREIERDQHAP
jgi:hypothetical protein